MTFIRKNKWLFLTALALLLVLGGTGQAAAAPSAETAAQAETPWLARYWDNIDFTGDPIVERYEDSVTHRWAEGSPAAQIGPETFSARWTNDIYLDAGTYRFTTISDDGIRVWVDGQQIINNWTIHPEAVNSEVVTVDTGFHPVRVDYFENTGEAIAVLTWEQVDQAGDDSGEETITISPLSGPVGTTISVDAAGFSANVPVTVGLGVTGSEPSVEKVVTSTAAGRVQTTITVPAGAEAGETWRVLAIRDGERALSGPFTVTDGQTADPTICGNVYIVQPGDWLSRIARRCNTTVDALLAANPGIANANIIRVGQRLILPGGSDVAAPRVSISPTSGPSGTDVALNAAGFAPNTQLRVEIAQPGAAPAVVDTLTTNSVGAIETTVEIPTTGDVGENWIVTVSGAGETAQSGPFVIETANALATTNVRLRLRSGPSTATEILDVVPAGTTLPVQGKTETGDWIQVTFDGQTGWMAAWYTDITGLLGNVPVTNS